MTEEKEGEVQTLQEGMTHPAPAPPTTDESATDEPLHCTANREEEKEIEKEMEKAKEEEEKEKGEEKGEEEKIYCKHLQSAYVDQVRRAVKQNKLTQCGECPQTTAQGRGKKKAKGKGKKKAAPSSLPLSLLWVCLGCGAALCGDTSANKHLLSHSKKDKHKHCLYYQLGDITSSTVWCVLCQRNIEITGQTGKYQAVSECLRSLRSSSLLPAAPPPRKSTFISPSPAPKHTAKEGHWESGEIYREYTEQEMEEIKRERARGKREYEGRGLNNLGNSCFFNSILQNLFHLPLLREAMMAGDTLPPVEEVAPTVEGLATSSGDDSLPAVEGLISSSLRLSFVRYFEEGRRDVFNPTLLFQSIGRKVGKFKGRQQQDAHELLRCLLDHALSEQLLLPSHLKTLRINLMKARGDDVKLEELDQPPPANGNGARSTLIGRLFGGSLISSVTCHQCAHVTLLSEPFLDLLLPIPSPSLPSPSPSSAPSPSSNPFYALSAPSAKQLKRERKKQRKSKTPRKAPPSSPLPIPPAVMADGDDNADDDTPTGGIVEEGNGEVGNEGEVDGGGDDCAVKERQSDKGEEVVIDNGNGVEKDESEGITAHENRVEKKEEKKEEKKGGVYDKRVEAAERYRLTDHAHITIENCLFEFTMPELLCGDNAYACDHCSLQAAHSPPHHRNDDDGDDGDGGVNEEVIVIGEEEESDEGVAEKKEGKKKRVKTTATKQYLLSHLPPVVTLVLKRFTQVETKKGVVVQKVDKYVKFPLELDLAPFLLQPSPHFSLYQLTGIAVHSGGTNGGHYVAYVNQSPHSDPSLHRWFSYSDSHKRSVSLSEVLNQHAYLLFYHRLDLL